MCDIFHQYLCKYKYQIRLYQTLLGSRRKTNESGHPYSLNYLPSEEWKTNVFTKCSHQGFYFEIQKSSINSVAFLKENYPVLAVSTSSTFDIANAFYWITCCTPTGSFHCFSVHLWRRLFNPTLTHWDVYLSTHRGHIIHERREHIHWSPTTQIRDKCPLYPS